MFDSVSLKVYVIYLIIYEPKPNIIDNSKYYYVFKAQDGVEATRSRLIFSWRWLLNALLHREDLFRLMFPTWSREWTLKLLTRIGSFAIPKPLIFVKHTITHKIILFYNSALYSIVSGQVLILNSQQCAYAIYIPQNITTLDIL